MDAECPLWKPSLPPSGVRRLAVLPADPACLRPEVWLSALVFVVQPARAVSFVIEQIATLAGSRCSPPGAGRREVGLPCHANAGKILINVPSPAGQPVLPVAQTANAKYEVQQQPYENDAILHPFGRYPVIYLQPILVRYASGGEQYAVFRCV